MLTIQCDQHADYDGTTAPEYECAACRCLRAFQLDCAPADVAGHLQYALALGVLRVADQPAPTETGPLESAQVRMSKTLCGPIPCGRPDAARNEASGETKKNK